MNSNVKFCVYPELKKKLHGDFVVGSGDGMGGVGLGEFVGLPVVWEGGAGVEDVSTHVFNRLTSYKD